MLIDGHLHEGARKNYDIMFGRTNDNFVSSVWSTKYAETKERPYLTGSDLLENNKLS